MAIPRSLAALAIALAGGASPLALSLVAPHGALASCELETPVPGASGNNPPSGSTVICSGALDNQGVVNAAATGVTVNIEAPSGGISTTGQPGVLLGAGTTVNVNSAGGSRLPINTSGDDAAGVDVLGGATINVDGQVTTAGENSPAIRTTDGASVTVGTSGLVSTGGGNSAGITVGANSSVTLRGGGGDVGGRVTTGNSNSDAIVLSGANSTLTIENGARVTTSSGMSNPVQIDGADSTVNVSGRVASSSGDATAILGTADGLTVEIREGGFVTAQSSGSNAIESQGSGATIRVLQGGEVSISSGNSAAIVSGADATVEIGGTISASSSQSQGVVLGDGSTLTVLDRGVIETSSSESQAVLIESGATTATVNVNRGGNIDAVGAQAIVDEGTTDTEVTVDGTVFGGSSEPVLDMRGGDDTVTVNGTVRGSTADPVIDLGAGDDTLNNNSSQTISGPGTLAAGGTGNDTLNLSNGTNNDTSRYSGFETTNVGRNQNPNDPANGQETTLNVNSDQSGNTINANNGGRVNINDGQVAGSPTVNVNSGGTAGITADNASGTGSGQGGATINFNSGSTADVASGGGSRETQSFSGTTFNSGTSVSVNNSDIITGTASGNQIQLGIGPNAFGIASALRSPGNGNAAAVAAAIDAGLLSDPAALDAAIASGSLSLLTTGQGTAALLSRASGEIAVQGAAGGIQAALGFTDALRPGGVGGIATPVAPIAYAAELPASEGGTYFADIIAPTAVDLAPAAETGVWIAGLGGSFDVGGGLGAPYDGDTLGVALGIERAMNVGPLSGGTAGIAFGYTNTDVANPFDTAETDAYHVGAYADGQVGIVQASAALAYTYLDIEGNAAAGANGTPGFDADGHVFTSRLDAAIDAYAVSGVTLGPVGRLEYTYASLDALGPLGPLGTTLNGGDLSQFVAGIGARAAVDLGSGTARVDVVYERVFGDEALIVGGTVANTPFAVGATVSDEDRFRVGAGYDVRVGAAEVGLRYDGTFSDDVDVHAGSVRATFRF